VAIPWLSSGSRYPARIVCVTEEPTEVLYAIGAGDLVVGVSGFTVRPKEARSKPRVSTFLDANHDEIVKLAPDLVIGFSDLQADLAAELIRRGIGVAIFNQRSIAEILQTVRAIAALVGKSAEGEALADALMRGLDELYAAGAKLPMRPRVFFEEWPDPLISGIRWVSELIELVGGEDVCAHTRSEQGAKGRIVDVADVARARPDVIVASWCGKMAKVETIRGRTELALTPALVDDQIYEIKSSAILQPGPAALGDGARALSRIVHAVAFGERLPRRRRDACRSVPDAGDTDDTIEQET
jgi:iron complex transport system substrate-binding protein